MNKQEKLEAARATYRKVKAPAETAYEEAKATAWAAYKDVVTAETAYEAKATVDCL